MTKLYILVFSSFYDKDEITKFLDTKTEIEFWFSAFPSSIFIKSELTPKAISNIIREQFGIQTHMISEIDSNYWGNMTADLWKHFPPVKGQ